MTLLALAAAASLLFAADRVVVGNKVVIAPGDTRDIEQYIAVDGHVLHDSPDDVISLVSARTRLEPTLLELLGGWLDPAIEVTDRDRVLGDRTPEENRQMGFAQMDHSVDTAIAVALEYLGHEVITPIGAQVSHVMPGAPADGSLSSGDVIQSVNGVPIESSSQLAGHIRAMSPGDIASVEFTDDTGAVSTVEVVLAERDAKAVLGVVVSTSLDFHEPPFDVNVDIEDIGGPSAGLALTMSVIDALTPQSLTGGLHVVATGTIAYDGRVGEVGGVPQKTHAVLRSGADLFLVPVSQAAEASDIAGDAVEVRGVTDLQAALDAIAKHRADAAS